MQKKFVKGLCVLCASCLFLWYGYAALPAYASDGYEAVVAEQNPNMEVKATYSGKFQPLPGDAFCITYESQSGEKKHISLDASLGLSGYMEDGIYRIIGINYVGANQNENSEIKNTPVASIEEFRIQGNEMIRLSLAIGEQAIQELQDTLGKDNIYSQEKADSPYNNDSTPLGVMLTNENPQEIFRDISLVGGDPEERQRYVEQLEEAGLVDENFQYTDKAKKIMEKSKEQSTPVGADVIQQEGSSLSNVKPTPDAAEDANDMGGSEEISGSESPASGEETSGEGEADVKVKYFAKEEEIKEEEKGINPIIRYMFKYLPMMILFVGMLLYLIYQKKK